MERIGISSSLLNETWIVNYFHLACCWASVFQRKQKLEFISIPDFLNFDIGITGGMEDALGSLWIP